MTPAPPLIDIGANLTNKAFRADLEPVLARARAAGVTRMVITGTSLHESECAAEMAAERPDVLCSTAGIHPHNAKICDEGVLERIKELAARPEVRAIGECGLDFNRDFSPRPAQKHWFEEQVKLAGELGMPMFLHEREAADALLEILDRYRGELDRVCVHCFTGEAEALAAYLERGFHIGITGWICDERRGTHLQELVKRIPLERLMLETDSPYLVPRTIHPKPKGRRNEPAFLTYVLETVARCLGRQPAEVAAATTATAERFFDLG
ncbi:MAG: TatD family hydrolase [Planctomycetota bacterium]